MPALPIPDVLFLLLPRNNNLAQQPVPPRLLPPKSSIRPYPRPPKQMLCSTNNMAHNTPSLSTPTHQRVTPRTPPPVSTGSWRKQPTSSRRLPRRTRHLTISARGYTQRLPSLPPTKILPKRVPPNLTTSNGGNFHPPATKSGLHPISLVLQYKQATQQKLKRIMKNEKYKSFHFFSSRSP